MTFFKNLMCGLAAAPGGVALLMMMPEVSSDAKPVSGVEYGEPYYLNRFFDPVASVNECIEDKLGKKTFKGAFDGALPVGWAPDYVGKSGIALTFNISVKSADRKGADMGSHLFHVSFEDGQGWSAQSKVNETVGYVHYFSDNPPAGQESTPDFMIFPLESEDAGTGRQVGQIVAAVNGCWQKARSKDLAWTIAPKFQ